MSKNSLKSKMTSLAALTTMMAMTQTDEFWDPDNYKRKVIEPKLKTCIVCGSPHDHNNSFCSANCCKSYKKSK